MGKSESVSGATRPASAAAALAGATFACVGAASLRRLGLSVVNAASSVAPPSVAADAVTSASRDEMKDFMIPSELSVHSVEGG